MISSGRAVSSTIGRSLVVVVLLLVVPLLLVVTPVACLERVNLYPFGTTQGDQRLPVGDDVSSSDVHLDSPIAFFDEVFTSLYVNLNGLVSFETEIPDFRSNLVIPFGHKVVAPFLADIDINLSGNVYYRETQDPSLLRKSKDEITRAFPDQYGFVPESLFIVTWDDVGAYQNQHHPTNTFQLILVSDGHDSFAMFLYPDDGINWIQGQGKDRGVQSDAPAQAGFDSGEPELFYTLPGSGRPDVATTLTGQSNSGITGVWLFHIGGSNGRRIVTPDMSTRNGVVSDSHSNSCADGGQQTCSSNARCTDYDRGFCCACSPPFIGNGEDCIRPDEAQRVSGRVSGVLNGERIDRVDFHAYIVTTDGRTYTAISRIPPSIGYSLQSLYTVGSILGFLFALPQQPRAKNGFMLFGSHFNRTATVQFQASRQTVTISQSFTGQDAQGHMRMNAQIDGNMPQIGEAAKVEVEDYNEEYRRVSPGVVKSHSTQKLLVDDTPIHLTIDQTINYEECAAQPLSDFSSVRLSVSRNFVVFSDTERMVRYSQTNKASVTGGTDDRLDDACSSLRCDPNAECNPQDRPARCRCRHGYEGDGYECIASSVPGREDCNSGSDYCDVNAQCIYDGRDRRYTCRCNDGFEGDGRRCSRRDCRRDPRVCDVNARCDRRGSENVCVCNPGFQGDGYNVCTASGDRSNYLIYTQGMYIMETPFTAHGEVNDQGKQTLYIPGQTAIGIDVDCQTSYFYWTDVSGHAISRAKLDGTDSTVIVRSLGSPEGVAIDWLSKNMYWTDSGVDRIELSRLDGTHHKTLFSTDLVNPRAIVLDPIRGVMFWTDWNRDAPKIEKSNMDGTERKTLISDGIALPNGLTLDFDQFNVCWGDAGTHKIECANYDGRNRRVLSQSAGYPFGLTYAQDIIYWTDWERVNIPNINKNSDRLNEEVTAALGANGRMYGVTAVRSQCPSGSNPCIHNNGGCRFLCLPSSKGGRTCACPDDISPDECNRLGLL